MKTGDRWPGFPDPVHAPRPITVVPWSRTMGGGGVVGDDPLSGAP